MTESRPRLVTGLMLGSFLAFGVDTLVVVGALWYVGRLSDAVAGGVSVAVPAVFAAWLVVRWVRLRRGDPSGTDDVEGAEGDEVRAPLDRLKARYAEGELSDAEFERRLDGLLDADYRTESTDVVETERVERSRHSE